MEIQTRLEALAWKRSIPFCYGCYHSAPSGRCESCMSDDLMRLVQGVGCEYGIEWVVEHLVKENVTPVDLEEAFADSVSGCYPETVTIGWIECDTVTAIKELDPVSWDLAKSEWADSEEKDGQLATFDNGCTYFWVSDIETFLDEAEA
jgi:hypothetical protein